MVCFSIFGGNFRTLFSNKLVIISKNFVLTSVSSDEPTQRTSTSSKTTIPNNKRRLRLTLSSCDTINCTVEAHIERKQLQRRLLLVEDIFFSFYKTKASLYWPWLSLWFNPQTKMFHLMVPWHCIKRKLIWVQRHHIIMTAIIGKTLYWRIEI